MNIMERTCEGIDEAGKTRPFIRADILRFSLIIYLIILSGCGTLPNSKGWGEDATFSPGWDRLGRAAINALESPLTWGPAAGAALLQIDNWDRKLSNWASDKTPIFGSRQNAQDYSNYLLLTSGAAFGATALLAPSGEQRNEWLINKTKGLLVEGTAFGLSAATTEMLKETVRRKRPDASGSTYSFPSGHATAAASFTTLAAKNIDTLQLPKSYEVTADIGLGVLAAGTAWGRVEAKKHYPSDVLAGITLGHFISAFITDAFLGAKNSRNFVPEAELYRNGVFLRVSWSY